MTLGRTVLFLTWCIPEFSLYLVCRGVCETTPSRVGKMLVSVTSSAILPLFSFLVICLCVSRDHSCPGKTSKIIKPLRYKSSVSFLPNTEQQKIRLYFSSSWTAQLSSLAGIAGSFLLNPKVQQERLERKSWQKAVPQSWAPPPVLWPCSWMAGIYLGSPRVPLWAADSLQHNNFRRAQHPEPAEQRHCLSNTRLVITNFR